MNTDQERRVLITKEIIRRTSAISTLQWKLAEMDCRAGEAEISSVEDEVRTNREALHRLYADLDSSSERLKEVTD